MKTTEQAKPAPVSIILPCDSCGLVVGSWTDASVWLDVRASMEAQKAQGEHAKADPFREEGAPFRRVSLDHLMKRPADVEWQWGHRDCPEGQEGVGYWLPGDAINTPLAALNSTLHLMGKAWFVPSTWSHLLRRIGVTRHA